MRRAELLMPAGSLSRLKTAVLYGADAVYAGTPDLSLRTHSDFSLDDLAEGIAFTHAHGKRIYLTLNLFTHNRDVEKLPRFVGLLRELGPDGVIVSDPGVFQYLGDHAPELERHISTQANVASHLTVDYWKRQGAALCVLAREVSFEELSEIRHKCPDIRLETFVHGAMCMTYSGRCLLSNYMAERGSNQGSCAHSCRWKYRLLVKHKDGSEGVIEIDDQNKGEFEFFLEEEFRRGQLFPIEEDERGSYILNSRDLCLMPKLDQYLSLGVDSLKVEGRNKNEYYVATVTRAYRHAIDAYYRDPAAWDPTAYLEELWTSRSRGYTLGFHEGRLSELGHDFDEGNSLSQFEFAGFIRAFRSDGFEFELRNRMTPGDVLEFLLPTSLDVVRLRLYEYVHATTGEVKPSLSAGQGQAIFVPFSAFHEISEAELRRALPVGSVGRKRSLLDAERTAHLKDSQRSFDAEQGLLPLSSLRRSRENRDAEREHQNNMDAASGNGDGAKRARPTSPRAPAIGIDGCCGLGCNGCLMFWNEPKFEKARLKLRATPGSRLEQRV